MVKTPGSGLLMVLSRTLEAVQAAIEMQRVHSERSQGSPENAKFGCSSARAGVTEQSGGYFGDAVNLASGLSDRSSADRILGTYCVIDSLTEDISSDGIGGRFANGCTGVALR